MARSGENKGAGWSRAWWLVRSHRPKVLSLGALSFLCGGLEALFLVVATRIGLAITSGKSKFGLLRGLETSVSHAIGIAAVLLLVRMGLATWSVSISTSLANDVASLLRQDLAHAFLRSSWSVQQSEPAGRLQQLLTAVASSSAGVVQNFAGVVSSSLNLVALVAFAVVVNPIATLVVVAALVGLGLVLAPLRRRIKLRARATAAISMEFANSVAELGSLGLEMQAFGVRNQFEREIDSLIKREADARRRASLLQGMLPQTYTSLAFGALLVGLGVTTWFGVGELSGVGAVMLVMLRSLSYGQQVQAASGGVVGSLPSLEQVDLMLERYRSVPAAVGEYPLGATAPICFERVGYEYVPGQSALDDVSVLIEAGHQVGVVGPSGGGKTTLVQLMLGVRTPTAGAIMVGGRDLATVRREDWSARVAFVPQNPSLLTGTVAENIRFFRGSVTYDDIVRAAEMANVREDIEEMNGGFDAHLGERGTQLSGGQRQRISIARALAGAPSLLILDEPTSALDATSERLIRDSLESLRGEVTVVVIAHRMSTIANCDRIIVIEHGKLTAFGAPNAVLAANEFYRESVSNGAPS